MGTAARYLFFCLAAVGGVDSARAEISLPPEEWTRDCVIVVKEHVPFVEKKSGLEKPLARLRAAVLEVRGIEGNRYLVCDGHALGYIAKTDAVRASEAVAFFTAELQRESNSSLYYFLRGKAYCCSHDFDRALADFNRALALEPAQVRYLLGRALAWSNKEEPEKALADVNEALKIKANHSDCHFVLAQSLGSNRDSFKPNATDTAESRHTP